MSETVTNDPTFNFTTGEAAAAGGAGGAVVGALATLLREKPSLKKALKNSAIGAAAGAALGAGGREAAEFVKEKTTVDGSTSQSGATEDLTIPKADAVVSPPAAKPDKSMDLRLAAISGLLPGVGPALHGGLANLNSTSTLNDAAGNIGQAAASAGASLIGPSLVMHNQLNKGMQAAQEGRIRPMSGKARLLMPLLSILGATGAAAAGNKLRE